MKYSTMMSNLLEREKAKPALRSSSRASSRGSSSATAKAMAVGLEGR